MRRGVFHSAIAPCAAAAPAEPVAAPGRQSARHLLVALITFFTVTRLLLMPLAGAPTLAAPPLASAQPQNYAAWSCRGAYHVVRRGETIYSIARRYGTTAYRIAVCNGLASYTVYVGQTLLVPLAR
jgi:hypothetical protein